MMDDFWKTVSIALLCVILGLAVEKGEKDIAAVLGLAACSIAAIAAVSYLEPVLDLLWELQQLCAVPRELLSILLKAVGIGLVAELASAVCTDAGSGSLGKMLQILGGAAVLTLSIPMIHELMTIIKGMIGEI